MISYERKMAGKIKGIHHVTAIAGNAATNREFYTEVLGLRLVKKTVNFDDPGTYHLYFGNTAGEPGTILTFFPWQGIRGGRRGTGQVTAASFKISEGSIDFWLERFRLYNVTHENPSPRFGEEVIVFHDPDGLMLELAANSAGNGASHWLIDGIGKEDAVKGLYSATLTLEGYESTANLLTDVFGYKKTDEHMNRYRFRNPDATHASIIDLVCVPSGQRGSVAVGSVHHIAFRVSNEAEQLEMREKLMGLGFNTTPQLDRNYFKSVYFREPGGVLFEIATDLPGFTVDENINELGEKLMLPEWLEGKRKEIESVLPKL